MCQGAKLSIAAAPSPYATGLIHLLHWLNAGGLQKYELTLEICLISHTNMTAPQDPVPATSALAHFFVGLMKVDGLITVDETSKLSILVRKFSYGLPASPDAILIATESVLAADDFAKWKPNEHLEEALKYYHLFVESGRARNEHHTTLLDLLDILADVDGLSENEQLYLKRMQEHFAQRYATGT